jgi:hypothetical protein
MWIRCIRIRIQIRNTGFKEKQRYSFLSPDPPSFSLVPTFKGIVQPFELGGETTLI